MVISQALMATVELAIVASFCSNTLCGLLVRRLCSSWAMMAVGRHELLDRVGVVDQVCVRYGLRVV